MSPTPRLRTATTRKADPPKITRPRTSSLIRVKKTAALPAPTQEAIAQRAYELFLAREGATGDALSDWLQAERDLGV